MKTLFVLLSLLHITVTHGQDSPTEFWINECIISTDGTITKRDTLIDTHLICTKLPTFQSYELVQIQIKNQVDMYLDVEFITPWEQIDSVGVHMVMTSIMVSDQLVLVYYIDQSDGMYLVYSFESK